MATKRWAQLNPQLRRFIVIGGTVEALLKVCAIVDLIRRPAELVRGSKVRWAAAIVLTNSLGAVPLAYLIRARRPHRV